MLAHSYAINVPEYWEELSWTKLSEHTIDQTFAKNVVDSSSMFFEILFPTWHETEIIMEPAWDGLMKTVWRVCPSAKMLDLWSPEVWWDHHAVPALSQGAAVSRRTSDVCHPHSVPWVRAWDGMKWSGTEANYNHGNGNVWNHGMKEDSLKTPRWLWHFSEHVPLSCQFSQV